MKHPEQSEPQNQQSEVRMPAGGIHFGTLPGLVEELTALGMKPGEVVATLLHNQPNLVELARDLEPYISAPILRDHPQAAPWPKKGG